MAWAVVGPTPGRPSSWATVAVLRLTGPSAAGGAVPPAGDVPALDAGRVGRALQPRRPRHGGVRRRKVGHARSRDTKGRPGEAPPPPYRRPLSVGRGHWEGATGKGPLGRGQWEGLSVGRA